MPRPARVAGADGCRAGWICHLHDLATGEIESRVLPSAHALLALAADLDALAIDIPIGLPEAGPRPCDRLARKRLGGRRGSSVFPAPVRPALGASSRAEASEITFGVDGRKVSAQAWGIYGKIREVDRELRRRPELQAVVREVHPELSFWAWNGFRPLGRGKRTPEGKAARLRLVLRHFGDDSFRKARDASRRGEAGDDDILDAFAALWTAARIAEGRAKTVPDSPPRDARGLRMEIVF